MRRKLKSRKGRKKFSVYFLSSLAGLERIVDQNRRDKSQGGEAGDLHPLRGFCKPAFIPSISF